MLRSLSAETRLLLESLYVSVPFWRRAQQRRIATLDLIRQAAEPSAIRYLVALLLDKNRAVAREAASTAVSLGKLLRPEDLSCLDQSMRDRSSYSWSNPSQWTTREPTRLKLLERFGDDSAYALGLFTFHRSGYIRQDALNRLKNFNSGTELPFLLLRLNDWVPEVRICAANLVRERLNQNYAPFFVSNLGLLAVLRTGSRRDAGIIVAIEAFLKGPEGVHAVDAGLASEDMLVRRACYRLALESSAADLDSVVERALAEADPAIRVRSIEVLGLLKNAPGGERLLRRALSDRSPGVRLKALQTISERFPGEARRWLEEALLASHPAVRGYAQFQLGLLPGVNLRRFYLHALAPGREQNLYAAISGLGETGAAPDAADLIKYAFHDLPKIRRVTVRALARLDAANFVKLFEERLADSAGSVSREAARALTRTVHLGEGERVWDVFNRAIEWHCRHNALFVLSRLRKWESIGFLMEALCGADDRARCLAEVYVRRWYERFNLVFTDPTEEQATRLTRAVENCRHHFAPGMKSLLRHGIRSS